MDGVTGSTIPRLPWIGGGMGKPDERCRVFRLCARVTRTLTTVSCVAKLCLGLGKKPVTRNLNPEYLNPNFVREFRVATCKTRI
jgi:hypothetical protein